MRQLRISPAMVVVLAAGLLLSSSMGGADFGRYWDWSVAFSTGDIFRLRSDVASPLGIPLSQWSHGPGALFALPVVLLRSTVDVFDSPMVAGWLTVCIFWWAFLRVLRWAAQGSDLLVIFGAAIAFVGTHAGFASRAYASESIAYALIAIVVLEAVSPSERLASSSLLVGVSTALLLVSRSYLIVYALPALLLVCWRIVAPRNDSDEGARGRLRLRERLIAAICLGAPMVVGVGQWALVNRWMTGLITRSPYVYQGGDFRSVDWLQPEFKAVLFHPWHGLLAYHPLYGVGFVAAVICLVRSRTTTERVVWGGGILAVLVNLYVQAAWFAWWLGTDTFGMRGMAGAAVLLTAAIVRILAMPPEGSTTASVTAQVPATGEPGTRSALRPAWLAAVAICCVWSFLLLTQGVTQFLTYEAMFDGQRTATAALQGGEWVVAFAAGALLMLGIWRWLRITTRGAHPALGLELVTMFLGVLSLAYLLVQAMQRSLAVAMRLALPALLLVLLVVLTHQAGALVAQRWRDASPSEDPNAGLVRWVVIGAFVASTVLFIRLAMNTEGRLARDELPRFSHQYTGSFQLSEARASYREYGLVHGFEQKKAALQRFLNSHGIFP